MSEQKYLVVTDACSDIIPEYADKEDIRVIPMEVTMTDGKVFDATYDNKNMSMDDFYQRIVSGQFAMTTAITPQRYLDFMRPLLSEGNDILYNCFTSGMSSTYNNAVLAAEQLRDEFPDRKLFVVDSLSATGGQGYHTYFCALNRDNGMPIEDNAKWLENTRDHIQCSWTVNDLMHLNRGGRLSKTAALVGTALNLKPIGDIDDSGHLVAIGKARGRHVSISKLCEMLVKSIDGTEERPVLICHCDCLDDAQVLKEQILMTGKVKNVVIGRTGPVVGTHLGPSGLTCFYFCDRRLKSI
ncbi:MAG: DegV family protein [Lachnospiraceae bacterium]|nr:DegV family protein [Lachnospiraceae bacterium]